MKNNIKKARKKAEYYLISVIDEFISRARKDEKDVMYPSDNSLNVGLLNIFEAFSYMAHKSSEARSEYAEFLMSLLSHWASLKTKNSVFWPSLPPDCRAPSDAASNGVPILKVIETVGIPGFQGSIESAIKEIKKESIFLVVFSTAGGNWENYRSDIIKKYFQAELHNNADYILGILKNKKYKPEKYDNEDEWGLEIHNFIGCIMILEMSQKGGDSHRASKLAVDNLVNLQAPNGSILDCIGLTCDFIFALYLTNIDSSKIIQNKALNWLLEKQHELGLWGASREILDGHSLSDYFRRSVNVYDTVKILEAMDLITGFDPLPSWIPGMRQAFEFGKSKRQTILVRPFRTKEGDGWDKLKLEFISEKHLKITCGEKTEERDYSEMGLVNKRSGKPSLLWNYLLNLARNNGAMNYTSHNGIPLGTDQQRKIRSNFRRLRSVLKDIFVDIEGNPLPCKKSIYEARFKIFPHEISKKPQEKSTDFHWKKGLPEDDIDDKDREIEEVYLESIQTKIDEHKKAVQSALKDEIEPPIKKD